MQVQSFLSTFLHSHMGVYETRLFMRIVERCQCLLPNAPLRMLPYAVPGGWSYKFSFTLSSLTNSHNYGYIKRACEHLKDVTIRRYDPPTQQWRMCGLVKEARLDAHSGVLILEVADWVCEYILDFRKGWRSYDIDNAMTIRNPYALRMYLITCTQGNTLTYNIDNIKGALLGDDATKYANNGDFIRRCIAPAAKELERLHLNGFNYKANKGNGAAKGKIQSITITPVKREEKREKNISETRREIADVLPKEMMQYLITQLGFSTHELGGRNLPKFQRFAQLSDWPERFTSMVDRMRRHHRGHGWLINAIDKEGKKYVTSANV